MESHRRFLRDLVMSRGVPEDADSDGFIKDEEKCF